MAQHQNAHTSTLYLMLSLTTRKGPCVRSTIIKILSICKENMFANGFHAQQAQPPPPPPPGRPFGGGGIFQDLIANAQHPLHGDVAHLAIRVSALEQMVALQQQNNDIMIRLINALTAGASGASGMANQHRPMNESISVVTVLSGNAEEAIDELRDLKNNGVRRAAF